MRILQFNSQSFWRQIYSCTKKIKHEIDDCQKGTEVMYRSRRKRRAATFERLENRNLMVADWRNEALHCDVDNSGIVEPLDALIVINTINRSGARSLTETTANVPPFFYDVNGDNSVSHLDVLVIINAINRAMPVLTVSSTLEGEQDLDLNGVINDETVSLRGETGPNSTVTIRNVLVDGSILSRTAIADSLGVFNALVPLGVGLNRLTLRSVDELGVSAEVTGQIRRGSLVSEWNASLLNQLRKLSKATATAWTPAQAVQTKPPGIARNLAMIYGAMFDAANAVQGGYEPFLASLPLQTGANPIAAASAAAHRVATSLYADPEDVFVWDATYNETLRSIPNDDARSRGIELGESVARLFLANRTNDGSQWTRSIQFGTAPGDWHPSAPSFEAVLPQWPDVTPFVVPTALFQVEPPPSLSSSSYADALNEVMRLGSSSSSERTADQTAIAKFWADGSGTASPPGHWNQITADTVASRQVSVIEQIRSMALVNFAMADAGVASWKAKYEFELWRPIDAIRNAELDSNDDTAPKKDWSPLIVTPPFPSYVSGHSSFSSAASAVLTQLFGSSIGFISHLDNASGWQPVPKLEPSTTDRAFSSFEQAASEAGLSRIFGGIHFNFDNVQGAKLGQDIGRYVAENALKLRLT